MTNPKIDNYKIFLLTIILAFVTITLDPYFTTEYRFYDKVNAQTIENEIIVNTLETIEKVTTIEPTLDINFINTPHKFIQIGQSAFNDNNIDWKNGESEKLSFKYPSNWDVKISDSRFDNYEILFTEQANNASIRVSDEAIQTTNKVFLTANDPQGYFDIYMMQNSPLSSTAQKIETYPKGKVSIAELQAYSELYLDDKGYAFLISIAFQEGNDRHYTVSSSSPSSKYDNLEPVMIEIIKSITPKGLQNSVKEESENSSNNNADDESKKKQPSFMIDDEEFTKNFSNLGVDNNQTTLETNTKDITTIDNSNGTENIGNAFKSIEIIPSENDTKNTIDYNRELLEEVKLDLKNRNTTKSLSNLAKENINEVFYDNLKGKWIKFKPNLVIETDNNYLDILSNSKFSSFMKKDWGVDNIDEIEWILYNITDVTENHLNVTGEIKRVGLNHTGISFSTLGNISDFSSGFNFILPREWSIGDTIQMKDNIFKIKNILSKQYFGNNFDVYEVINEKYSIDENYPYAMEFITSSYYDNKTRLLLETILNMKIAIPSVGTLNANASLIAIDWSLNKELSSTKENDQHPIINILDGAAIIGNPNYEPKELTVNKNSTITVNNTDTMPHTITDGKGASDPNSGKNFDTSIINGGNSVKIDTSNINKGTHPFYCMVHPYMTGTLIIQ